MRRSSHSLNMGEKSLQRAMQLLATVLQGAVALRLVEHHVDVVQRAAFDEELLERTVRSMAAMLPCTLTRRLAEENVSLRDGTVRKWGTEH